MLNFPFHSTIKIVGYLFVILGFIIGLLALIEMRNSWRVGIKHNQKTTLITTGIYNFSRNPYFLSYGLLIFGFLLVLPSVLIFVFYACLMLVFHNMILEEEQYLEKIHSENYLKYKRTVNRYFTFKKKKSIY